MNVKMRELRLKLGLSQEQAARRANITLNMWSMVERGKRTPSLAVARRICAVLDTTLDELFGHPQS